MTVTHHISNFNYLLRYFSRLFLWNCFQECSYLRHVNICSANGLIPSHNKPSPESMLTMIIDILARQQASISIHLPDGAMVTSWFVCLFVSLLSHFWLIHFFHLRLLYQPYLGLCQAPCDMELGHVIRITGPLWGESTSPTGSAMRSFNVVFL